MVVFTENNITFYVNYNHILYRVENKNSEPKDVFIPSVLPDGTKIKGIERDFAVGEFGSISIDDGISLSYALGGSFSNMHAERLVWPQGITNITPYTFSNSVIGEISNLAHVDSVDYRAFLKQILVICAGQMLALLSPTAVLSQVLLVISQILTMSLASAHRLSKILESMNSDGQTGAE